MWMKRKKRQKVSRFWLGEREREREREETERERKENVGLNGRQKTLIENEKYKEVKKNWQIKLF